MSLSLLKNSKEKKCTNCGTMFTIFYRSDRSKKCCSVECATKRKSHNKIGRNENKYIEKYKLILNNKNI